ncbi:4Fe-4S binding protein [Pelotomaculum isophthalicicum]|uniref:4Fe-4S binding protein n=1 Tax=Pelotomaculum isophthalicicum TaxID=342448 RepID=UPI003B846403
MTNRGDLASSEKEEYQKADPEKCIHCGECLAECKTGSIIPLKHNIINWFMAHRGVRTRAYAVLYIFI